MSPDLLPEDWRKVLSSEFAKPSWAKLVEYLAEQRATKTVFPPENEVFTAFHATPYEQVKVVLFGQDPYHGPNQAHGMSFSVKPGVPTPPSLVNMYKELKSDLGFSAPDHGNLTPWARQGMLLLNAVLTVRQAEPNSHAGQGWEQLTDAVITALNARATPVVFLLWGSYAKKKAKLIKGKHHKVIEGTHPSPLSAHMGFFGSKPYSNINKLLEELGHTPIDWALPTRAELGTSWKAETWTGPILPATPAPPRRHPLVEKLEATSGSPPDLLRGLLESGTFERLNDSARTLISERLLGLLPKTARRAGTQNQLPVYELGPNKESFVLVLGTVHNKVSLAPYLIETQAHEATSALIAATPAGDWQLSDHERLMATLSAQGLTLPTPEEREACAASLSPDADTSNIEPTLDPTRHLSGGVASTAIQVYDAHTTPPGNVRRVRRLFYR